MKRELIIRRFLAEEFLPDIAVDDLAVDYDLLDGGVVDSLGLLKVISWLEHRFSVSTEDVDLGPDDFRSAASIAAFVDRCTRAGTSS